MAIVCDARSSRNRPTLTGDMTTAIQDIGTFNWQPQPRAAALVREVVDAFHKRCPGAADLAKRMKSDTGTRFGDWIDFIQAPRSAELRHRLLDVGFTRKPVPGEPDSFIHEGAMFPTIVLDAAQDTCIGVKVDSVVDFLAAWHITDEHQIEGDPLAAMRKARVWEGDKAELWVVERHGYRGFAVPRICLCCGIRRRSAAARAIGTMMIWASTT